MNIVGAVSRAGEKHSVLFCEYTDTERANRLIGAFLEGLNVSLDYTSIYCVAVLSEDGGFDKVVGIYYHKGGAECMAYERPFEYLTDYVEEIFGDKLKPVLQQSSEKGVKENAAKGA